MTSDVMNRGYIKDVVRADRLLSILLSLQARGRLTAAQLADELEVSVRTVHRDMQALCIAGVPVYAERGPRGGWILHESYRSGPRGLHADELRALFLATPGTVLGDLGLDRASESALTKLLLAAPAADRAGLEQTRQRVLIDVTTWRATEPEAMPFLAVLQEAIWRDRKLHLDYGRADGVQVERLVDPLGLVAKGSVWYLVAATEQRDIRTYRVSRVRSARLAEDACELPEGFDLATYWQASKERLVAGVPRFSICVEADAGVVGELKTAGRWSRVESVGAVQPNGRARVTMQFELEEDACAFVLSFGPRVVLLEPPHLRREVATRAEKAAAQYRD
jgi:predicted DNA-binding transcriptional regulator YafY